MEKTSRPARPGELAFGYVLLSLSLFLFRQAHAIEGFASPSSAGTFPLAATGLEVSAGNLAPWQANDALDVIHGGINRIAKHHHITTLRLLEI